MIIRHRSVYEPDKESINDGFAGSDSSGCAIFCSPDRGLLEVDAFLFLLLLTLIIVGLESVTALKATSEVTDSVPLREASSRASRFASSRRKGCLECLTLLSAET